MRIELTRRQSEALAYLLDKVSLPEGYDIEALDDIAAKLEQKLVFQK